MPSSTPAASVYSCRLRAFGSVALRLSPSYTRIFAKMVEPRIHAAMLYLKTGSVRDGLHYLKTGAFPEVAPVEQAPAVAQS